MMHYFQQLIAFAQQNSIMFASIVIISFVALFILIILLLNPKKVSHATSTTEQNSQPPDISAIAGDDVCVTQLDLARAYIELGKTALAKQILENVFLEGDHNQQQTAKELLLTL
jgi:FimV-like protein